MLHHGELLKKRVGEVKPDLQEFAKALEMTTQNLYNLYKREKIQKNQLEIACNFLGISITEFQLTPNSSNKAVGKLPQNPTVIDVLKQRIELLESINDSLRDSNLFFQNMITKQIDIITEQQKTIIKLNEKLKQQENDREENKKIDK